jgi:PEP-CTERM motif
MSMLPKIFAAALALAASLCMAGMAQATPLEGSVSFGFSVTPTSPSSGATITNLKAFSSTANSISLQGSGLGSLAFLVAPLVLPNAGSLNGQAGAGSAFNFGLIAPATCPINTICTPPAGDLPVPNFIVITDGGTQMTFELLSVQFERIPLLNGIVFAGTGSVCITGEGCGGGLISFSVSKQTQWSGSGTISVIPEPPTLALLGAALLALGFLHFRKKVG